MTNGEVVIRAIGNLGVGFHSTKEIAIEARRQGFFMSTSIARMAARGMALRGVIKEFKDTTGRYWFGAP